MKPIRNEKIRFEEFVDRSGNCWEWKGVKKDNGGGFKYGVFSVHKNGKWKSVYAHRYAWKNRFGKIPKGLCVCHKCDNPSCVNPDHLFCGTAKDNAQDASRKGRSCMLAHPEKAPRGERNGQVKINAPMVLSIRKDKNDGMSISALSRKYPISESQIQRITVGKSWKHVICN